MHGPRLQVGLVLFPLDAVFFGNRCSSTRLELGLSETSAVLTAERPTRGTVISPLPTAVVFILFFVCSILSSLVVLPPPLFTHLPPPKKKRQKKKKKKNRKNFPKHALSLIFKMPFPSPLTLLF